jgi:hypothetical protein
MMASLVLMVKLGRSRRDCLILVSSAPSPLVASAEVEEFCPGAGDDVFSGSVLPIGFQ